MQSPHPKKFMANSKPPAYTYNMNGINISVPVPAPVPVPVSVPFTTISHAYNNYVTDDQLQNGNDNGNRIENSSLDDDIDEVVRLDPETEEYFNSLPSGYRFCPTDVELINDYLKKKLDNVPLPRNKMHEANLYKYSPEKISKIYPPTCEKVWYFFTPRDRKYCNGTRPNRAAGTGYWKATGADKQISHENQVIGVRKALVFYEGKAPNGQKMNWIMQEFRVNAQPREKTSADDMRLDDYVLCRIYKKNSDKNKQNNNSELQNNNSELQNNNSELQINNINELQTVREDMNCSFGYCQEQIPTYSLPQNYATPTATVATPVSSMPVYSETAADYAAAAAAIVPDSTASGDILYSSTQSLTDYELGYYYGLDGKVLDGIDVNDYLCNNFEYSFDVDNDSYPSKRQKKD